MRIVLRPACYSFAPGHRVAIALSGADAKHFAVEEGTFGRVIGISWGGSAASCLSLPVLRD